MTKQQRANRIPVGVVSGIVAAVVVGGGAAWWTLNSLNRPTTTPIIEQPTQSSSVQTPAEHRLQVYWLQDTGKRLELVPKSLTLAAGDQPNVALKAAFNHLLAGPTDSAVSSTIPKDTKLRSVKSEPDGIHVDLSQEFTTGGGSTSMTGRVAQILYTATSLQPTAKVWIDVEGKPLETLGGEGLELKQPLTRQGFEQNFTL